MGESYGSCVNALPSSTLCMCTLFSVAIFSPHPPHTHTHTHTHEHTRAHTHARTFPVLCVQNLTRRLCIHWRHCPLWAAQPKCHGTRANSLPSSLGQTPSTHPAFPTTPPLPFSLRGQTQRRGHCQWYCMLCRTSWLRAWCPPVGFHLPPPPPPIIQLLFARFG